MAAIDKAVMEKATFAHVADASTPAVTVWACVGIVALLFECYVLARWIGGPHFVPTDPGIDAQPESTRIAGLVAQVLAVVVGTIFLWCVVMRDRLRRGEWSTTALLGISWCAMWFWDPMMNYTSGHILYNSHLVNFGSWTLGSMPGWVSPNGNLLPEPLLIVVPGYPLFCLGSIMLTHWALQKYARQLSKLQMVGIALLGLAIADTVIEIGLVRTGLYVFPGGIREVTLFAGQQQQFPLTEALTCGLAWTANVLLLLWRDDKGLSFVERGADKLKMGASGKRLARFFAVYGYSHLMVFALWVVPNQWLALNSDPYPTGYPSYLVNNMCVYGVNRDQCPGPGVMIPRP